MSVSAHRMVLAAASEYFSTMFTTDMIEKHQKEIKIKQVTGESLKLLVSFCYTGEIEIKSENVVDLLAAASMFRFEKIEEECRKFLEKQLQANVKTSLRIFLIAEIYSFTALSKKSMKIVCNFFAEVSKTLDFNEIMFEFLKRILDSDERFNVTEEEIFEAAMKWVDYNRSKREKCIPNILKLIRLTQISSAVKFFFN